MGCDNNCEAIAGLHESAANLIQYEKLIDKWLNGKADETVTIAGKPTPTLLNLAMSIKQLVGVWPDNITIKICADKKIYVPLKENGGIHTSNQGLYIDLADFLQAGGGLGIDNQGRWFVDFDQMPTTKFDAILEKFRKGLRLPKWLTANTIFYVDKNHVNASNTLDEGRGLSANLPFETIQACVNYVVNNYNVGNYNLTIQIAAGEYSENVTLTDFSRNSGLIFLAANGEVKIVSTNGTTLNVSGGKWRLRGLKCKRNIQDNANPAIFSYPNLLVMSGGDLYVDGCGFEMDATGKDLTAQKLVPRMFYLDGNAHLEFGPGVNREANTLVYKNIHTVMWGFEGSRITTQASSLINTEGMSIICEGSVTNAFIDMRGGAFSAGAGGGTKMNFTVANGKTCTGKRYYADAGGKIDTNSGGPDFFPGSIAGSVNASTYSWYK